MSLFDLSGRIAIVTGGNGGIGLGMAEALASPGAIPTRLAHPRGISAGHFLRKPTGEINGTAKPCTTPSVGL
jgi:NAD(P)-dependent dehydrogenase (short-subunit alcohol dehydrogenase family)